jgi:hypothetical protein
MQSSELHLDARMTEKPPIIVVRETWGGGVMGDEWTAMAESER